MLTLVGQGCQCPGEDLTRFLMGGPVCPPRIAVRLAPYDAMILPTTANTPPRIADLADDKAFTSANLLALRNCSLINVIDGCAISLPAHRESEVPVGLMLAATGGADRRIFELAAGMEGVVRV